MYFVRLPRIVTTSELQIKPSNVYRRRGGHPRALSEALLGRCSFYCWSPRQTIVPYADGAVKRRESDNVPTTDTGK